MRIDGWAEKNLGGSGVHLTKYDISKLMKEKQVSRARMAL
jgi:hypothetical protein